GLAVPGGAADGSGQVHVDPGRIDAGQVVDGDGVGAAEGVDGDGVDAAEVHRAAVEVAGDLDPSAVGREVELLRQVRAVDDHRVGAASTLDGVAAVAGVPDEGVGARTADQRVVAGAAVHGQPDQLARVRREQVRGVYHVVAAQHVHRQDVHTRVLAGDMHEGNSTHGGVNASSDGPDLADIVYVGAVDDDRVGMDVEDARGCGGG